MCMSVYCICCIQYHIHRYLSPKSPQHTIGQLANSCSIVNVSVYYICYSSQLVGTKVTEMKDYCGFEPGAYHKMYDL